MKTSILTMSPTGRRLMRMNVGDNGELIAEAVTTRDKRWRQWKAEWQKQMDCHLGKKA